VRQADLERARTPGYAGGFSLATRLLSGVTAAAVLAFLGLVVLDTGVTVPGADDGQGGSFLAESDQSDRSSAYITPSGFPNADGTASSQLPLPSGTKVAADQNPPSAPGAATAPDAQEALRRTPAGSLESAENASATELQEAGDDRDVKAADSSDGDSDTGLRTAEAITAAVALAAGGSLALVWWRRRDAIP
jgi:hypothetical protein